MPHHLELPANLVFHCSTPSFGWPQCYAGLSRRSNRQMTTIIEILTVPAVQRRLARQLSLVGVAVGTMALALLSWLAVHQ